MVTPLGILANPAKYVRAKARDKQESVRKHFMDFHPIRVVKKRVEMTFDVKSRPDNVGLFGWSALMQKNLLADSCCSWQDEDSPPPRNPLTLGS